MGKAREWEGDADPLDLVEKTRHLGALVDLWWRRWTAAGFTLFSPRRSWSQPQRPLSVGDIVLLRNEKHFGRGNYRLARVLKLIPDSDLQVRTVLIGLRDRRGREKTTTCKKGLVEMVMAVQRLVTLLPIEEQWSEGLSKKPEEK